MDIRILACESLGVRSMACSVTTADMKLVIDPGVALAPRRFKLPPTAREKDEAQRVQQLLERELEDATHVALTHFHGDHHPMVDAEASQLSAARVAARLREVHLCAKGPERISRNQARRRLALEQLLRQPLAVADGRQFGSLRFSEPVPHGERTNRAGAVVMLLVAAEGTRFVHGSDIQLLDDCAVDCLANWKPDVAFVAGPPSYLLDQKPGLERALAARLKRLGGSCGRLVLDHHLMRSLDGERWLDAARTAQATIECGADFARRPRTLLEARRRQLRRG